MSSIYNWVLDASSMISYYDLLNSLNSCKPESVHFVTCPKQGREMEAVVLHRVGFLAYPCPKQGQDFKPSAAPLYPNMGQVPPPPPRGNELNQREIWVEQTGFQIPPLEPVYP